MIFASPTLSHALSAAGLIDEWRLTWQPVIVGGGLPLFGGKEGRSKLELRSSKTFRSGVVATHHVVRRYMMRAMRIMMTLQGDSPIDEIDAYLAAQGATVLGSERLDPAEVATISASGDEPPIVDRAGSLLRAVWILDVASRAAAVSSRAARPAAMRRSRSASRSRRRTSARPPMRRHLLHRRP